MCNVSTQENLVKLQDVLYEIMEEIDFICRKNDIKYQLFYGTLLGAVRHNNFIPWDDDVDIIMTRDNYNKFLEIAKRELDLNRYFLQDITTDNKSIFPYLRIRKEKTVVVQESYKKIKMHQGIFVSIFPLDNIVKSPVKLKKQTRRLSLWYKYYRSVYLGLDRNLKSLKSILKNIIYYISKPINIFIPNNFFINKLTKISKKYNYEESNSYGLICFQPITNKNEGEFIFEKSLIDDCIDKDFRTSKFMISRNNIKLLKQLYGNYLELPKINDRKPSHSTFVSFNSINYKRIK